jgi:hypothetical protein
MMVEAEHSLNYDMPPPWIKCITKSSFQNCSFYRDNKITNRKKATVVLFFLLAKRSEALLSGYVGVVQLLFLEVSVLLIISSNNSLTYLI